MTKQCHAPGCASVSVGFSKFCNRHKQNQRRHGSPIQKGVTAEELRPYLDLVEARKTKNPNSAAWSILHSRWGAVGDGAKATLQRYADGRPARQVNVQAAHHLRNVAAEVTPWVVIKTALAMFILKDHHPQRFTSEEAFDFQLVRRVLRLALINAGVYWDHKESRSKRVYRDVSPQVIRALAEPLKEAFGVAGLMLAAKERREILRANDERRRLASAMEGLE